MSDIKVCNGYSVQFSTQAPKTGKGGPRKLDHTWSILEENYARMLRSLKDGITHRGEDYKFVENELLSDHPKFKNERPIWSGQAIVQGVTYDCHVFTGSVPVFLND